MRGSFVHRTNLVAGLSGPGTILGIVLVLVLLASGSALVISEVAARSGERSGYRVHNSHGERFEDVVRIEADDNAGTAVAFSRLAFPQDGSVRTVIIGRDDVFADNLAAGVLQHEGPLLLTGSGALNESAREEIARLGATQAVIVGGPQAVSPAVAEELRAMGLSVTRLQGATRVETAVEVARHAVTNPRRALLVRARDERGGDGTRAWADSISAGAYAALAGIPLLLTDSHALHPATAEYLGTAGVQEVHVVGGRAAVDDGVLETLGAMRIQATRVSGPERAATAVAVALQLWEATASVDVGQVVLIDGFHVSSWAAGVSAAAFSRRERAPIVLSREGELPAATEQWLTDGGQRLVCGSMVTPAACQAAASRPPQAAQASPSPSPIPGGGGPPPPSPTSTPRPPGTVSLTDDRNGQALFTFTGIYPGDTQTQRITVMNDGEEPLVVRLYGTTQGALQSSLRLRVRANPGDSAVLLFEGTLQEFGSVHAAYATGVDHWASTAGQERVYEFTAWLPAEAGNGAVGLHASASFIWEGRGDG